VFSEETLYAGAYDIVDEASVNVESAINFRGLFKAEMDADYEVAFPDFPSSVITTIIDYLYLNELELTPENVMTILVAADYLAIDEAVRKCSNYILNHLDQENCIPVYLFAK